MLEHVNHVSHVAMRRSNETRTEIGTNKVR